MVGWDIISSKGLCGRCLRKSFSLAVMCVIILFDILGCGYLILRIEIEITAREFEETYGSSPMVQWSSLS